MKIVHLEDFFHPDAGYQINILTKYQFLEGNDVTIITSGMEKIPERLKGFFGSKNIEDRDKDFTKRTGVKVVRYPIFKYYSGRAIYKVGIVKMVNSFQPDVLFVHGNDTYAGLLFTLLSKRLAYPIIFDNHMLGMAASHPLKKIFRAFYRIIFSKIIIRHRLKVIRVVNDDYVIKNLGIPLYLAPLIPLGTDIRHFMPDEKVRKEFRGKHKISENAFIVLYMGKVTSDKGVLLLAEAFQKRFETKREIILVLVGNTSSEYGIQVIKRLESSANKLLIFPTQKYNDLAQFYQMADLSVFPRHCSLSFYDAQSCGLPVLLEANNINIDRLKSNNGFLFKPDDSGDLRDKILEISYINEKEFQILRKNARDFILQNDFDYSKIMKLYNTHIDNSISAFRKK